MSAHFPTLDPVLLARLTEDRHWLHAHAELGYEEQETSAYVKRRLDALGIPYVDSIAETGIVAEIRGRGSSERAIGLRADMDALPISEKSGVSYASGNPGNMHACGHDGHTTMLLGAAELLAKHRDFDGIVRLIFQPAEESGRNGGEKMIAEGLFERFPMEEVYALHNMPMLPLGTAGVLSGPCLASGWLFDVILRGRGGHGSRPELATPLVPLLAKVISAVETYVTMQKDAQKPLVATLCELWGANAPNILPGEVRARGSMRCLDEETEQKFAREVPEMIRGLAQAFGAEADVTVQKVVPVTRNAPGPAAVVAALAGDLGLTLETEETGLRPDMGSEDFAFMLEARPGCYVLLGSGRPDVDEEPLHSPRYDFNDEAIAPGVALLTGIAKRALPLSN